MFVKMSIQLFQENKVQGYTVLHANNSRAWETEARES